LYRRYKASCTGATSILYWRYKRLVLVLQASCTDTTNILYRRYKVSCSVCTRASCGTTKRHSAGRFMAKWGVRTTFHNQV